MLHQVKTTLRKTFQKPDWHNLRRVKPISRHFGFSRGLPVDRIYIEDFLSTNSDLITGSTLEIAENTYSKKYGKNIKKYEILHATDDNPEATIVGDLADKSTLPENSIDCFICTQTLNFIYDFKAAIEGAHYLLKKDGVMLTTVAGLSQIVRYDMDRWGDYWRFTDLSIKRAFEEVFGDGNVTVNTYGNILAATALMHGLSADELTHEEIMYKDKDYQMIIGIVAKKIS